MDVQKTMEFILDQQAQTAVWQMKTERRMGAITKLIETGMKILVKTDRRLEALAGQQRALAEQQRRTEDKLERLIDFTRRGSNGRKR